MVMFEAGICVASGPSDVIGRKAQNFDGAKSLVSGSKTK